MFKNKNANRILCIMLSLIIVFSIIPATAFADDSTNGLAITGDNGYTYTDGVLNITEAGDYTIENTDKTKATTDTIVVSAPSEEVNITLDGVNIVVSEIDDIAAFEITGECTTNIILADESINTLISGEYKAGLANNEHALTINCAHVGESGHICTDTCGTLNVTGGYLGAGIGGNDKGNGSNIAIAGGSVTSTGGTSGAGIGGGTKGNSTNITISGGIIETDGGYRAAGIGGGDNGSGSNITISGGNVIANGGSYSSGIGGGYSGDGTNITISGGVVTANGGGYSAGIGGGDNGSGSNITISGDYITAIGGVNCDAIGSGYNGDTASNIMVSPIADEPVIVVADGSELNNSPFTEEVNITDMISGARAVSLKLNGYGFIVTGDDGYTYNGNVLNITEAGDYAIKNTDNIVIATDTIIVTAPSGEVNITLNGVNIDVSRIENSGAFEITGECTTNIILADNSVNTLKSGKNKAGLTNNEHTLTITCAHSDEEGHACSETCGTLNATGGYYGAGIGGGVEGNGTNITISGGAVIVTGGHDASILGSSGAGIGGGYDGDGSNITISGGTVTATGGSAGAGIGGGSRGRGTDITISGGTVTAIGDDYSSAGIGGGNCGSGTDITISGGTVIATGSSHGAGIGGGYDCNGSNITISGGTVTATGGIRGAGIGGGDKGSATGITISGGTVTATGGALTVSGGDAAPSIGSGYDGGSASNIKVSPAADMQIAVIADNAALYGSPFTTETDITNLMSGVRSVILKEEVKPGLKDLIITGDSGYTYENDVLNITEAGNYTIENRDKTTATQDTIIVSAPSGKVNITLNGVNIDVNAISNTAAFEITGECTTNIILADESIETLISGKYKAGLANNEHAITINCAHADEDDHVCSETCGTLNATGGEYGAGIGGSNEGDGSNITISGGNIIANGGNNSGAGIGGGDNGNSTNIAISGGNVTANGGYGGAGIGGGRTGGGLGGNGTDITISGGTVTATGGIDGAGIGGGLGGNGTNITISAGTVSAAGGNNAAGIGGGYLKDGSNITISGGTVTATGGENAMSIGSGRDGTASNIKVSPAVYTQITVTADDTPLDGSPFIMETDITTLLSDVKKVIFETVENTELKDLIITGDSGYTYENDVLNITEAGDYTIKNLYKTIATTDTIVVSAPSGKVNITLDGVNIDVGDSKDKAAIEIIDECTTNVILADESVNTLISGLSKAGIANNEHILNINCAHANEKGHTCSETCGTLKTTGGRFGAGIGGNVISNDSNAPARFRISDASGEPGETITINVEIYDNKGLNGGKTTLLSDAFTVTDIVPGSWITPLNGTMMLDNVATGIFDWYSANTFNTESGIYAVYTVKINEDAIPGTYDMTLLAEQLTDDDDELKEVDGVPFTATLTVEGEVPPVHEHDFSSEWKYDATNHWQVCKEDGEIGQKAAHKYYDNQDVTCDVCSYERIISEYSEHGTNITISGGNIIATGGDYAAGIGGGYDGSGTNITINGGNVTAIAGHYAAGIGGGYQGNASNITIMDGDITATGSEYAAGIGGGRNGSAFDIAIFGGNIAATGGDYGAGIGGGSGSSGTDITVSGGIVNANGGDYAAGIGGGAGWFGVGTDITISGGTVTAISGTNAAAIGGGSGGETSGIKVSPVEIMQITATTGGEPLDGSPFTTETDISDLMSGVSSIILNEEFKPELKDLIITGDTGYTYTDDVLNITEAGDYTIRNLYKNIATSNTIVVSAPSGEVNLTLDGVNIDVSAVSNKAAFEITGECTTNIILADESINTLISGKYKAGLANNEHAITINCAHADEDDHVCSETCGTLNATGGEYGAGIGGSKEGDGSNITISGGNIIANGGNNSGAGIGGGDNGNSTNIAISGGNVTANGGYGGAGIGGGRTGGGLGGNGTDITISGGTVTATGGIDGAGIGGGLGGNGTNITISAGTVSAAGGNNAAGIGGGYLKDGSNITISGGTVTATCGKNAPSIGSGYEGDAASNIKVSPAANSEIAATTDGTPLDGSPFTKETDITELVSSVKSVIFKTENYGSNVIKNATTGALYESISDAIADAASGDVVKLVGDCSVSHLMIPEGVTLDMNGKMLEITGRMFASYGNIVDGTGNGEGGLKIGVNDFIHLQADNTSLPIYDTANGCYRLFNYEMATRGVKDEEGDAAKYGFTLYFDSIEAYKLLINSEETNLDMTVNLSWTGMGNEISYTVPDATLVQFATTAVKQMEANGKVTAAITFTVKGLDNLAIGTEVWADSTIESTTDVSMTGTKCTYTKS